MKTETEEELKTKERKQGRAYYSTARKQKTSREPCLGIRHQK